MLNRAMDHRNFDVDRRAIGFWMAVDDETPVRPVRVFITYEALADIDPSQLCDREGALTTFDMNPSRSTTQPA
jgi:hypothetical protein